MFEATDTQDGQGTRDTILEVRNANISFEMGRGRARVLNDVNIDIYRGETFGIVGESGSGKSVFVSSLLDDVEDPGQLSGEITYHPESGEAVDILELGRRDLMQVRWEEIAMMYQGAQNAFNPVKPIDTHFRETFAAHNRDRDEGMEEAREILRDLNLNPDQVLDSYQHELSGGQRQRALIALSLILDPEILVLDEPTAALDLITQRTILKLLDKVREEYDLTVIVVTHDLPIVSGFADRIGVMYGFEFVEVGDTDDVMYNAAHPYTRLLLKSTPTLDTPTDEVISIEGDTPDPVNVPSGCSYHPRCPISDDRCEIEDPELLTLENSTQQAACFYVEESQRTLSIPLSKGDDR